MGDVRDVIATSTYVLAVAAAIGFVVGFVIGDRRWTMRRVGLWAAFAGVGWVLIPPFVTWAASQWALGADSVIEVAVREAVGGLRSTALVLMISGIACYAASFVPAVGRLLDRPDQPMPVQPGVSPAAVPAVQQRHTAEAPPPRQRVHTRPAVEADFRPAPAPAARTSTTLEPTAEMPPVRRQPTATGPTRPDDELPIRELAVDSPDADQSGDDDLWDFYAPRG